jgi:dihydrofolate reductase
MNGLLKYVASRTLEELCWQNSALLTGDVASAVAKLKREDGGEIQVHGSGGLSQTLLRHDLVDELHLLVFPGGAVLSTYTRTGVVEYGAMGPETGNWR